MTQEPTDSPPDPTAPSAPEPPDDFSRAVHYVLLTLGLYFLNLSCLALLFTALRDSGFYVWYYGPDFVAHALSRDQPDSPALTRLQLWAIACAFPFWLLPTILVCGRLPASYRRDLGVTLGRFLHTPPVVAWSPDHATEIDRRSPRTHFSLNGFLETFGHAGWHGQETVPQHHPQPGSAVTPRRIGQLKAFALHVMLGVAAWVVIVPPVFGVNWLCVELYKRQFDVVEKEHGFTVAAKSGSMRPLEWGLLAISVLAAAPVLEELLFRGLLPAVFRRLRGLGSHAALILALATSLLLRQEQLAEAKHQGLTALSLAAAPTLFVLALTPLYALLCWRTRTGEGPVVFGASLLFAMVHTFAWPSPVALFLLALGLGWLAVWTRSLIAPIVVHSLFNAVTFALLFFSRSTS